jgi:DNA-binding CsgD family transcriptional regulator
LLTESLILLRDRTEKDPTVIEGSFVCLGAVAAATGRAEQAACLFGAGEALHERHGLNPFPADRARLGRVHASARAQLPDEDFSAAWATGRVLPLDRALDEALALAEAIMAKPAPDDRPAAPAGPAAEHGLTPRELEVWRLIAEGRSNREVADALFVSPRTAQTHTTRLLAKLGLPSRTAAAALAHRVGLT